ncbi:unnamed protein product [Nippostrongylus brasiliensis]|uniref:Uncharacterized protein n=1 Tax=Nippostrongylus brasiliensis TaxID=27835 RepID=A0A0N4XLK9_NIPBR|nr:unnamed protein product [Nippostrongylus brasiliensis]
MKIKNTTEEKKKEKKKKAKKPSAATTNWGDLSSFTKNIETLLKK